MYPEQIFLLLYHEGISVHSIEIHPKKIIWSKKVFIFFTKFMKIVMEKSWLCSEWHAF